MKTPKPLKIIVAAIVIGVITSMAYIFVTISPALERLGWL